MANENLTDGEFAATWAHVSLLNTLVVGIDDDALAGLERAAEQASSVGPLLDPSAFVRPGVDKFDELRAQRELIGAVRAYRAVVVRLAEQFGVEVPVTRV